LQSKERSEKMDRIRRWFQEENSNEINDYDHIAWFYLGELGREAEGNT